MDDLNARLKEIVQPSADDEQKQREREEEQKRNQNNDPSGNSPTSSMGSSSGSGDSTSVQVEKPDKASTKEDKVGISNAADASNVDPKADLKAITDQMGEILKKYNGRESDVPLTSDYWALRNRHLVLVKEEKDRNGVRY